MPTARWASVTESPYPPPRACRPRSRRPGIRSARWWRRIGELDRPDPRAPCDRNPRMGSRTRPVAQKSPHGTRAGTVHCAIDDALGDLICDENRWGKTARCLARSGGKFRPSPPPSPPPSFGRIWTADRTNRPPRAGGGRWDTSTRPGGSTVAAGRRGRARAASAGAGPPGGPRGLPRQPWSDVCQSALRHIAQIRNSSKKVDRRWYRRRIFGPYTYRGSRNRKRACPGSQLGVPA